MGKENGAIESRMASTSPLYYMRRGQEPTGLHFSYVGKDTFFFILSLEPLQINFGNKVCNLAKNEGGMRYGTALAIYKNLGSKSILVRFILASHEREDWERRLV